LSAVAETYAEVVLADEFICSAGWGSLLQVGEGGCFPPLAILEYE
jgi:hypothetical protein